jgi:hypothetical protein
MVCVGMKPMELTKNMLSWKLSHSF